MHTRNYLASMCLQSTKPTQSQRPSQLSIQFLPAAVAGQMACLLAQHSHSSPDPGCRWSCAIPPGVSESVHLSSLKKTKNPKELKKNPGKFPRIFQARSVFSRQCPILWKALHHRGHYTSPPLFTSSSSLCTTTHPQPPLK